MAYQAAQGSLIIKFSALPLSRTLRVVGEMTVENHVQRQLTRQFRVGADTVWIVERHVGVIREVPAK